MSLTSSLRRAARVSADVRAFRSPEALGRRAKNRGIAKLLGALGLWRLLGRLWR